MSYAVQLLGTLSTAFFAVICSTNNSAEQLQIVDSSYLYHLDVRGGKLAVDFIHVAHGHPGGQGAGVGVQPGPGSRPGVITLGRQEPGVRPGQEGEQGSRVQRHDVATTEAAL